MTIAPQYIQAARCRFRDLTLKVQKPLALHLAALRGEPPIPGAALVPRALDTLYREWAILMERETVFELEAMRRVEEHLCIETLWRLVPVPDRLALTRAILYGQWLPDRENDTTTAVAQSYWKLIAASHPRELPVGCASRDTQHPGLMFTRAYASVCVDFNQNLCGLSRLLKAGCLAVILEDALDNDAADMCMHGFLFELQASKVLSELIDGHVPDGGMLHRLEQIPEAGARLFAATEALLHGGGEVRSNRDDTRWVNLDQALLALMLPDEPGML